MDYDWEMLVQLSEIDFQRITCSGVAYDYFIVANDDCHYYVFDNIGYKLIDKGFVKSYRINCILML